MGQKKKMLQVYEEDILNLENIRNIMMNLDKASKVANLDIRPEMLTLNGLIDQFKEKSEADLHNKRRIALTRMLLEVYRLDDTRTSLLVKDIEALLKEHC
jgi:hypothetical protein